MQSRIELRTHTLHIWRSYLLFLPSLPTYLGDHAVRLSPHGPPVDQPHIEYSFFKCVVFL